MGRFFAFSIVFVVLFGLVLWGVSHAVLPKITIKNPTSLSASAFNAQPQQAVVAHTNSNVFDETGTIVLDQSDGPNGVPYILYTSYSESGKASIVTKRLVFSGESGCQASALPCATKPASFPVSAGQQVRIVGTVDAQNVFVSDMQILSEPAVPVGS